MDHLAVMVKKHHMSKPDALVYFLAAVASVSAVDHLGAEWQMGQIKELLADFAACFPTQKEAPNGRNES